MVCEGEREVVWQREKGCTKRKQSRQHSEEGNKQWGVYLRADTAKRKVGGENGGGDSQ